MKKTLRSSLVYLLIIISMVGYAQDIPTPKSHFGFEPGADGSLFNYKPLMDYVNKVDELSDRVAVEEIGTSQLGQKLYVVFVSSAQNIQNLNRLKVINKELAVNDSLSAKKLKEYAAEGKLFALATLSMHSNEVGPTQAAPAILYDLVTAKDENTLKILDDVVYMMVPCHNPDGMDMVVNHYNKYKGTKYEGSRLPGVYHKYVGHNINRDFVTVTQPEVKAISTLYSTEWYPQVMVEKHQMMMDGVRYFVPPFSDPISENIDEEMLSWTWVFGSNMAKDMTKQGQAGVSQHYIFDNYWPGHTETSLWKNVISLLTEAASAQYAKPVYVEPNEIKVYGKGLSEHKKSINLAMPWEGGWWRLSDIVEYEKSSTYSYLKTASYHKDEILTFRNELCKKSVQQGQNEAPYYYVLPRDQHDKGELVDLVKLLKQHGVNVYTLNKSVELGVQQFKAGDVVVPLAQSYRAFVKEVMEKQYYPERHATPGGELIQPYDITSWSLPLHRGLESYEINTKASFELKKVEDPNTLSVEAMIMLYGQKLAFSPNNNANYKLAFKLLKLGKEVSRAKKEFTIRGQKLPAGTFIINSEDFIAGEAYGLTYFDEASDLTEEKLSLPKIALVETWYHDMDAGWARWLLDEYSVDFKVLRPEEIKEADLSQFDMVIFPDSDKNVLLEGKYKSKSGQYNMGTYAPEYSKGMTKAGLANVMRFVNDGGKVVSWGRSSLLFMGPQSITIDEKNKEKDEFSLPIADVSESLVKQGLYCPGTLLSVELKADHPITYGLTERVGVFSRANPVYQTSIPYFDMDRRVIGKYAEKDIVLSGYAQKSELLANRPAIVWLKKGEGQMILMGFSPHFRGSMNGTFKLLFNSIML